MNPSYLCIYHPTIIMNVPLASSYRLRAVSKTERSTRSVCTRAELLFFCSFRDILSTDPYRTWKVGLCTLPSRPGMTLQMTLYDLNLCPVSHARTHTAACDCNSFTTVWSQHIRSDQDCIDDVYPHCSLTSDLRIRRCPI